MMRCSERSRLRWFRVSYLGKGSISLRDMRQMIPNLKATSPLADQYCMNLKVIKVVSIYW
jgi:hypothetical protein